MEDFSLTMKEEQGIIIFSIGGYLNERAGNKILEIADANLKNGKTNFICDFQNCLAINSPGIAALMDFIIRVVDDNGGKVTVCGLNNFNEKVLKVAGIIPIVDCVPNVNDAIESIKSSI